MLIVITVVNSSRGNPYHLIRQHIQIYLTRNEKVRVMFPVLSQKSCIVK